MRTVVRRWKHALVIAGAGLLGACGDSTGPARPAALEISAGATQTGTVGASVTTLPAVRVLDGKGRGLGNVSVTFAIASGGGSITGASAKTDRNGIATVGGWTLGTTPVANALTASVDGVAPVTFTATAAVGAAAKLSKQAGDAQSVRAGTALPVAPSVLVTDAFNNPVSGLAVTFALTSGNGTLTGASATTNQSGVAALGSWTLDSAPGGDTLTVTAASLTPVTFTAIALDPCSLSTAYTVGTTTTGELAPLDCVLSGGEYVDFFSFTTPQSATPGVVVTMNAAFDTYLSLHDAQGNVIAYNDDSNGSLNATLRALLAPGSYLIGASSFVSQTAGQYTFASSVAANVANCDGAWWITPGAATTQQLESTDCGSVPDSSGAKNYLDEYTIHLVAGQTVTIRMSSTDVNAFLYFYDLAGNPITDDDSAGGTDALLTYTATQAGDYTFYATAYRGQTGAYTLSIQSGN